MRASRRIFVLLVAIILATVAVAGAGIQLPPIHEHGLPNGLRLQVVEHPTVPLVTLELWIDAGATADPPGQEGLASLTVESLRKGAGDLDAAAFSARLDQLGARLSTSVDHDRTRISLELLSRDLETGLTLLADLVLRPRFDEEEVGRLAGRMGEEVLQAKDNPRWVMGDYHRAHLFADHPYGRPVDGTEKSVPALDASDVRRFHRNHYGAERCQLTIVGDVDAAGVNELVRERLGDMGRAESEKPRIGKPAPPRAPRVLLVDEEDTPQTWFRIGTLGPSWSDLDDYAATEIVQTVFGGRFTSWLNTVLRIEGGLTYGAGYGIDRMEHGGSAAMSTFTATETTKEAIDLALATLDRLHEEGLSAAELASAKAYVKGQSPYRYETASDLARAVSEMGFYGIDRSHVDRLFERIDAVTLEDCEGAIDRWFQRENLVMTAVGVADEVREVLEAYGELRVRPNDATGFDPPARAD